ncbi:MAG: helix-turn-helix domain-containing protein [Vicinamibacteria bacterium]
MLRAQRQVAADVLSETCPSRLLLDRVADKWTALVIHVLADGRRRFSQLEREIEGISQKMLTQTLRELEHDGLVERTVYPVVPPHVDYRLTPLGRSLREPLESLCAWAERHMPEIQASRARRGARTR